MTKHESAIRSPRNAIIGALFVAAIVAAYLAGLTMPLVGPDEPRYSQIAREMFERGDWITPTLAGFHWFEKPPLLYWLQIGSYRLLGISEFAARFGSMLFGLATVGAMWLLGRRVQSSGGDQPSTISFANLLALMTASTVGIIAFSHGASFDIILTFPITASMVGFFIYDADRRPSGLFAFYFFAGLALLAKGLVGVLFPFAIAAFYFVLTWKLPDRRFVVSLIWGSLLTIGIAAVWYVPMYARHGYEFIDHFFIQHHFQRFTSNKYLHPQPFYFFFWVLPLMTIPWMPFFVAAVWKLCRSFFSGDVDRDSIGHRLRIFSVAWIAVPLVFFSLSGSKLPGYILPVVPAAIILAGDLVYRSIRNSRARLYAITGVAAVTLVVISVVAIAVAPRFAEADSVRHLFERADERGIVRAPVFMLHGISHQSEFYATDRIVREADGKQRRFASSREVADELRNRAGSEALVLVPNEYLAELLNYDGLRSEVLDDNGEVALVSVVLK